MSATRGILVAHCLALTLTAAGIRAAGAAEERPASIDCSKERGALAVAICGDKAATAAERRLTATYLALYFSLEDDQRPAVRKQHVDWLTQLPAACTAIADPLQVYRSGTAPGLSLECVTRLLGLRSEVYRSKLSGDALEETYLSSEARRTVQQRLTDFKFLSGSTDGIFGASTRVAIRDFQSWIGHPQSNFLTAQEREALLGPGAPPAARNAPAGPTPLRTGGFGPPPVGSSPGAAAAAPAPTAAPAVAAPTASTAPTERAPAPVAPAPAAPAAPARTGALAVATSAFPPPLAPPAPPSPPAAVPAAAAPARVAPAAPASSGALAVAASAFPPPIAPTAPVTPPVSEAGAPSPAPLAPVTLPVGPLPPTPAPRPAPAEPASTPPPTPIATAAPHAGAPTAAPPDAPGSAAAPASAPPSPAPAFASPSVAPAAAAPVQVAAQTPPSAPAPGDKTDAIDQRIGDGDNKTAATRAGAHEPRPTKQLSETADARAETRAAEQAKGESTATPPPGAMAQALPPDPSGSHSAWTPALFILLLGAAIGAYYFFWHRTRLGRLIDLDELAPAGPRIPMPPPEMPAQTRPRATTRPRLAAHLDVQEDRDE